MVYWGELWYYVFSQKETSKREKEKMTKKNNANTPETGLRSIVNMIDEVLKTYKEFTLHIGDRPFGSGEFNKFRNERAKTTTSQRSYGYWFSPRDVSFATLKNYGVVRVVAKRTEEKIVDSYERSYRLPNGKVIPEYKMQQVMNILDCDDVLGGEWIDGEIQNVLIYTYVFDTDRIAELANLAATLHAFLD